MSNLISIVCLLIISESIFILINLSAICKFSGISPLLSPAHSKQTICFTRRTFNRLRCKWGDTIMLHFFLGNVHRMWDALINTFQGYKSECRKITHIEVKVVRACGINLVEEIKISIYHTKLSSIKQLVMWSIVRKKSD